MPRVNYVHVTVECSGCPALILNSRAAISGALRAIARTCHLNVIRDDLHTFSPHGITGYVLLSESHMSIHTWPEEGFALVDILSCSFFNSTTMLKCVQEHLQPSSVEVSTHSRKNGQRTKRFPRASAIVRQ